MKRFTPRFFVALLSFVLGIVAFSGWYLWRHAQRSVFVGRIDSVVQPSRQAQWTELIPLLEKHNLIATRALNDSELIGLEEADARLYAPVAGETLFLKAEIPTSDSKDIKPRYWLRVEDYPSKELAQKRASEYNSDNSNERIAQAFGHGLDGFMVSKSSLRIWAVARGKRVYALTTEVFLLTLIKLPDELKESFSKLPEI